MPRVLLKSCLVGAPSPVTLRGKVSWRCQSEHFLVPLSGMSPRTGSQPPASHHWPGKRMRVRMGNSNAGVWRVQGHIPALVEPKAGGTKALLPTHPHFSRTIYLASPDVIPVAPWPHRVSERFHLQGTKKSMTHRSLRRGLVCLGVGQGMGPVGTAQWVKVFIK